MKARVEAKADIGLILLDITQKDRDALEGYCTQNGLVMPNVKLSVYKNRRGSFTRGYLWMQADKGTCRYNPVFATSWDYEPIEINDFQIEVQPKDIEVEAVVEETDDRPLLTEAQPFDFDMSKLDGIRQAQARTQDALLVQEEREEWDF